MGNPIRLIDPDGRSVDDIIVYDMQTNRELRRVEMDGDDIIVRVNEDAFNNVSTRFSNDHMKYNTMLSLGALRRIENSMIGYLLPDLIAEGSGNRRLNITGTMRDGNNLLADVSIDFDAIFDNGSSLTLSTFEGVAGGYGNGAPENGEYTVSHYLDRSPGSGDYNSRMTVDGIGFSFNLDPNFSTGRSLLRIHPDASPEGTLGCVGMTCDLANFRDQVRSYLQNHDNLGTTINITGNPNNDGR